MKRLTTITVAVIFIISTMLSSAVCFATGSRTENQKPENTVNTTERSNDNIDKTNSKDSITKDRNTKNEKNKNDKNIKDKKTASGAVDTSWFDYKNPQNEYNITSEAQLRGLASLVNEEQAKWKPTRIEDFEGVTFKLTKDIELTHEWKPIGSSAAISFAGFFDGGGHTISNLKINSTSDNTGFFGYLKGEVKDLNVQGIVISNAGNCGSIVGELDPQARVSGCISDTHVKGTKKTGGIVGNSNGGKIENCVSKGNVTGTYKVGGVVGENWGGIVKKCGNEGKVSSSVRGVATFGTGGIAGRSVASTALVSQCYNIGDINSATEATGGVVGYINAKKSTVRESYSTGNIYIKKVKEGKRLTKSWVGGVIGVAGTDGIVIANCYGAGEIKGADVYGGVIGNYIADDDAKPEAHIKNNYYLNDYNDCGIGNSKNQGAVDIQKCVTGVSGSTLSGLASTLSISYMKDASGLYGSSGYPVLRWQEPLDLNDKRYLEGVSKDVQVKLDKYLINNTEASNKGTIMLSVFNPESYLMDALLTYSQTVDKEKKAKENKKIED